jgi:predicted alpha/beta-fold hydrolase
MIHGETLSSGSTRADLSRVTRQFARHRFDPPRLLRSGHTMTIFASLWPRRFELTGWPSEAREFMTEPGVRVVAHCHWQAARRASPTVIIVHGLEGSAEAHYVLGTAEKAFRAGFNVLRLNVRSCGGTEHLTPTLYHSGLTADLRQIIGELIERDELEELFLIGFSLGGNQSLKLAGELGEQAPSQLRGVCAISPPVELSLCSKAIGRRENRVYEWRFLRSLNASLRRKQQLFPRLYRLDQRRRARRMWDFDDTVTAPHFGFRDALDYYTQASSLAYIPRIRIPSLIIAAQDDPFIPFAPFADPAIADNPNVLLVAPRYGGHVGFVGRRKPDEDRYWAENRAVEFCALLSSLSPHASSPGPVATHTQR